MVALHAFETSEKHPRFAFTLFLLVVISLPEWGSSALSERIILVLWMGTGDTAGAIEVGQMGGARDTLALTDVEYHGGRTTHTLS